MTRWTTAAVLAAAVGAATAGTSNTITFDEVPTGTLADGLTIDIVTFSTSDFTADVNGGPGPTTFTSDPGIEGDPFIALDFSFGQAVSEFSYGFANASFGGGVPVGSTVDVFGVGGVLLGSFSAPSDVGGFMFPSGQVSVSGVGPIVSASVIFENVNSFAYLFDNLSYTVVPAPATTAMGLALAVAGATRRRR
ncbi:MAG: hypothetical protein CMJ31_10275 [Phycisphaerae bacterium]|nr:hypothetical protein [Phycisphaerae bacterium]